jgi:hypothetical protein
MHRYFIFLTLPLLLSGFTHLWNPIGFPGPNVDEGLYLGRAINLMDTLNPKDPYIGYDHPYFGQIFLAAVFIITAYQNLFSPTGHLNYELTLLIPRIVMGALAVLDTLLIFKIVESRYNTATAFIASTLFAVMPITWLTRWVLLDSIQLPFILSSILFAIISGSGMTTNTRRSVLLALLSGIFLGLSIFTKIPAFTMIPLTGYLIYKYNNKSLKILILWLVPIILIPALWPIHAVGMDEFSEWWTAIYNQTHRESHSLFIALKDFFIIDPILLIIAVPGLIYAAIKRDLFILLSQIPFLIFMYFIGYVIVFHLLLFGLFSCISSAKLFIDTLSFARKKRVVLFSSIVGILVIGLEGFISTTEQIISDKNSQLFQAARFTDQYLETEPMNDRGNNEINGESITRVSSPFFFWIDKYKFHYENIYYWNVDKFQTEKIIFIIDDGEFGFGSVLNQDSDDGRKFRNLFSVFDTHRLISFRNDSFPDSIGVDILLTDLQRFNKNKINATDILGEENKWTHSKYTQIQRGNGIINITADTSYAKKKDNVNRAFVNSTVNLNDKTAYLFLSYSTYAHNIDTKFSIELNDIDNHNRLWSHQLRKTQSVQGTEFFILPERVTENRVNLSVRISSHEKATDSLILENLILYH